MFWPFAVPTTCKTHAHLSLATIHPFICFIYPVTIGFWIWDHCFQVPYISRNQLPPTTAVQVVFQHTDNNPRKEDDLECLRNKGKGHGIFQIRIELTYPHFFCLLICIQYLSTELLVCVFLEWWINIVNKHLNFLLND